MRSRSSTELVPRVRHLPRAWASLGIAIVLISTTPLLVKFAGKGGASGPVSAFYRMAFASVAVTPMCALRRPQGAFRAGSNLAILAGLLLAVDLALWNSALLEMTAADAALLANNTPIWVGLLAWLVWNRRLGRKYWVGLLLAVAGTTLLLGQIRHSMALGRGAVLAVISSLFYAAYLQCAERARLRMDAVTFVANMSTTGAVALIVLCGFLRLPLLGFTPFAWLSLACMGVISHLGGWLAGSYALGRIPAARASVVMLLQTPLTALAAVALFGERISTLQLGGGLLLLSGVALAIKG